jgi:hypothetical protein
MTHGVTYRQATLDDFSCQEVEKIQNLALPLNLSLRIASGIEDRMDNINNFSSTIDLEVDSDLFILALHKKSQKLHRMQRSTS